MKFFVYIVLALFLIGSIGYATWSFYPGIEQEQEEAAQYETQSFNHKEKSKDTKVDVSEDAEVQQSEPAEQHSIQKPKETEIPKQKNEEVKQLVIQEELEQTETVSTKLLPPAGSSIYYGAFPDFGGPEDIVSIQRIEEYTGITKQKIAWAYFSNNWIDGIVYPASDIDAIRAAGTVPFVRIMPRSFIEQYQEEPIYSMQNIIDGKFDVQLRLWAQQAKMDPRPLLVDFAVEPNGDWFSWSGIFNGAGKLDGYGDASYYDGPERYRDAYRHIIDLFKEEDVTNITWFFHADIYSNPEVEWNKAKYYYPGDDYIDWVGVSLYGPQNTGEMYWDTFSEILKERASTIREISSTKPLALLEFGVTDDHSMGDKAQWIEDAFESILDGKYLQFDAVSYWHESWEDDPYQANIRVDSSEESLEMFQDVVKNPQLQTTLLFGVQ
jgi:hypothetical protein